MCQTVSIFHIPNLQLKERYVFVDKIREGTEAWGKCDSVQKTWKCLITFVSVKDFTS